MSHEAEEYDRIMQPLMAGDMDALEKLSQEIKEFPTGKDDFIARHWITNAIDCGNAAVVHWMLEKGAPSSFRDDEGYSPLLSAIERQKEDKYEMMRDLIAHGADINAYGINEWTPAHLAAARNDVEALRILHAAGADFTLRTGIDWDATPLEEARKLGGSPEAVAYLESIRA